LISCDRAIALKPDLAEARYNQGACQLALGILKTAGADLKRAVVSCRRRQA